MGKFYRALRTFLKKPEGFFIAVGLIAGGIFILIIPPLQTPDEYLHFYRAYEVSELKIPHKENQDVGSYLPSSITHTEELVRGKSGQIRFNPRVKYNISWTKGALLDVPLKAQEKVFYSTSTSPLYFPLVYAPQGAVIAVARLFNSPIIVMLYLARAVSLVMWLLFAYFAIKIFPWKKWALVGVCLLPVMVSQSISPGLDVIVYGCALLFAAIIFRAFAQQDELTKVQLAALLATGTLMTFGKSVAAALLFLVFLLKPRQMPFKPTWLPKVLVVATPVLVYMVWVTLTAELTTNHNIQYASLQLHNVVHNPFIFVWAFLSTFFFIWGDPIPISFVGNFGWQDTPLAATFVNLGYAFIAGLVVINYESIKNGLQRIGKWSRLLIIAVAAAYFVGTYLAMFIYVTEPGTKSIIGVQGRYFMPVLFLLIPILYSNVVRMKKQHYIRFVKIGTIALLSVSVATIIFRYYVTYF